MTFKGTGALSKREGGISCSLEVFAHLDMTEYHDFWHT